jgi:hypothetical protein
MIINKNKYDDEWIFKNSILSLRSLIIVSLPLEYKKVL